jgi:hypothetical protein
VTFQLVVSATHRSRSGAIAEIVRRALQLLAFEAYRDLVRFMTMGLTEEEGLAASEADNIAQRASAKSVAAAALGISAAQASHVSATAPSGLQPLQLMAPSHSRVAASRWRDGRAKRS